jgi:hypothetical protein
MAAILHDGKRMVIAVRSGVGDEIQITKLKNGGLDIEIDEPWAGSTETGFGATASVSLTKEQADALRKWLAE